MKKYLLLLLAIAAICIAGCKKNNVTPGNGAPPSADSYMPVTTGSAWTYGIFTKYGYDTVTVTMNATNATLNGKTYYTATSVSKSGSKSGIYFYQKDHVYAIKSFNTYADTVLELQVYNDTATVNHSWISSPADNGKINGTPVQVVTTITQKGLTKTIQGKTFTNVAVVEVEIQYNLGYQFQSTNTYIYYLGKGIGILGYTSTFQGEASEAEQIFSYSVK